MSTFSSLAPCSLAQRHVQLLRTIGDFRGEVAHRLAAEECHQAAIEFAARRYLLREAGLPTDDGGSVIGSLRTAVGSVLERLGGHRGARATIDAASRSAVSAP